MKNRFLKQLAAISLVMFIPACGQAPSTDSSLKWELYDVSAKGYPYSLINKVDNREIKVYIEGEESLLRTHITESIQMWTDPLPVSVKVSFVESRFEADLAVLIIPKITGKREWTTIGLYDIPEITLYQGHKRTVLLHEMGHAFGLKDTYVVYKDPVTGAETAVCDLEGPQPQSIMCLGGNGQYQLYPDDKAGIQQLYANRKR
jgi:hypothetical protein